MYLKIVFGMDNAAFDDGYELEASRILKIIADKIEFGLNYAPILDINGNLIGDFVINDGELK
jgi:hypothetical protein